MQPELIFDLNSKDLRKLLSTFALAPIQIERAAARAINKTIRWIRTQALRLSTAEFNIPQKAIKDRFLINTAKFKKAKASLWAGLNDIGIHRLGPGRKTKRGLKVRGREYPGAFQPKKLKPIFRRVGKARLPIEKVVLPLKASELLIQNIYAMATLKFKIFFERELNFESLKR